VRFKIFTVHHIIKIVVYALKFEVLENTIKEPGNTCAPVARPKGTRVNWNKFQSAKKAVSGLNFSAKGI
jgi:hypothetical protein